MVVTDRFRGFSLIEILVVLTIMMALLGLVGGSVVDGVSRARAQTEVISVFSLLKRVSVSSFTSGQQIIVSFEGHFASTISETGLERQSMQFEFLYFDSQKVVFHRNGLPNVSKLQVGVRGIERELDFASMFSFDRMLANKKL